MFTREGGKMIQEANAGHEKAKKIIRDLQEDGKIVF